MVKTCILLRGDDSRVEIKDEFELDNLTDNIILSLLVSCENTIDIKNGIILLDTGNRKLGIHYDTAPMHVKVNIYQ